MKRVKVAVHGNRETTSMLFKPTKSADQGPPNTTPGENISGRWFARHRKHLTPTDLARLALGTVEGGKVWSDLTRAQARALTGASAGYLNTLARCSSEQRNQVALGRLSLSALHNAPPSDD